MSKDSNQSSTVALGMIETYEAKVALEALERGGRNKNLHGVVHEILVKDKLNANPKNILSGAKAHLTQSTTAVRDDIVVKQAGQVVKRLQVKDTAQSISKTVKQVAEGKYNGTNLVGTKETAEAFNKAAKSAGLNKTMQSSGFSSTDTTRIAGKALGKMPTSSTVASVARSAGIAGAAISAGFTAISSGSDWLDGKISTSEYVGKVANEGVGGGISAAAGAGAATIATGVAATALASVSAPVWVPLAVGTVVAVGVGSVVKGIWDFFMD
ncbi:MULTISPECIES: hypothetical protein [Brevibacillus]|uniref:hypothetical protein n=1 Tax=Brevibacillus TaxID=55080 RepID=UPI00156268E8|nr:MULTISPECIES: hypothetical protein [Brevibacillus]MBE5395177.1 hypothetical protein [Brevibacillus borstelensis]MCM3472840.1 hypothetical protein [Brevibacillus borstelensis]MDN4095628.1 hypothetical protein [Brevibacillus agri]